MSEVTDLVLPVESDAAETSSDAIVRAHGRLQSVTMDPLAGLLHMGSLIYPTAIDQANPSESRHPLARLVEGVRCVCSRAHVCVCARVCCADMMGGVVRFRCNGRCWTVCWTRWGGFPGQGWGASVDVPWCVCVCVPSRACADARVACQTSVTSAGTRPRVASLGDAKDMEQWASLNSSAPAIPSSGGSGAAVGVEFSPALPQRHAALSAPVHRERSMSDITLMARAHADLEAGRVAPRRVTPPLRVTPPVLVLAESCDSPSPAL